MAKYHIKKDGTPGICRARVKPCPLGGDEEHFYSREEAEKFADDMNEFVVKNIKKYDENVTEDDLQEAYKVITGKKNIKLYHATYNNNLKSIKEEGLLKNKKDNWSGLSSGQTGIYLSDDYDVAESYAESSDTVDEETYESGIIVLEVNSKDIQQNLKLDDNISSNISYLTNASINPEKIYLEGKQLKNNQPVNISDYKFKNYLNVDAEGYKGRETYKSTLEDVSKEIEREYEKSLKLYFGEMPPYDQLTNSFRNINNHSSVRDMIMPSSEQGLKDAMQAIRDRQKYLLEQTKDYTKWNSEKRQWEKE